MLLRVAKRTAVGLCVVVALAAGYASPILFSWQTVTIANDGTEPLTVKIYNHVWTVRPTNVATFHFRSNQGDASFQIENGDGSEQQGYVTSSFPSCHKITALDDEPLDFQDATRKLCHLRWLSSEEELTFVRSAKPYALGSKGRSLRPHG